MTVVDLDTSGLNCPMPVLKARRALAGTPPGGLLRVRATDPGAVKDLEGMCTQMGLTFEGWRADGAAFVIELRKPA